MQLSRRAFLGAARTPRGNPVRPPWALPEDVFQALCTRCGDCLDVCPTHLLVKGSGGFPLADFTPGQAPAGCTFCAACVQVCTPQALKPIPAQPPWMHKAVIGAGCLAAANVVCRTCGERCAVSAIRFPPRLGGVALAQLDAALCNGCGACLADCPTLAITLQTIAQAGTT
jgi:ferredoxin-type protein NapF